MSSKVGRLRPSPAMVVACLALFVALAGTAFSVGSRVQGKNGVKSSDIAPKAAKTSDLGDAAVTAEKVAANAVTGDKVAANSLTGTNISYGTHRVLATNTVVANRASVSCPPGEIATGGGGTSADFTDTGALFSSVPLPPTGTPTGWEVFYEDTAGVGVIFAYAVCMPA